MFRRGKAAALCERIPNAMQLNSIIALINFYYKEKKTYILARGLPTITRLCRGRINQILSVLRRELFIGVLMIC